MTRYLLAALPLFLLLQPSLRAVLNQEDLILWYNFSEIEENGVLDQTPNELNGVLHNGPSLEAGKFGQALKFNGSNQKISVPHDPVMDTEQYTVAVWFNSVKSNEGYVGIFGRPGRHYAFFAGNSNRDNWFVHHRYKDGNNGNNGAGNAGDFPHNRWNHVVLTNDGRNAATYVNGILRTTGRLVNGHNYLPSTLFIGANPDNGNGNWFEGLLDDVRLYSKYFPSNEVARLYNNHLGDFNEYPEITLTQPAPSLHQMDAPFTPPLATASDLENGDLTQDIRIEYTYQRNVTKQDSLAAWWKFEPTDAPTNLLTRPEEFNNAAWVPSRLTVTANSQNAPGNSISGAETLTEDNTPSSSHQIHQVFSAETNKTYTGTVYVKADTRSHLSLSFRNYSKWEGGGGAKTTFDLNAETSTPNDSTPIAHSIQAIGEGWYRCRITAKATAEFSSGMSILLNDGTGTKYDGDGASQLFIWGAQVEEGEQPTPYKNAEAPEILMDSSPYASHGRLVGNAKFSPGKFGMALDLDGAGDYALIPSLNSLSNTSTITISAWANIESATGAAGGSVNDAAILASNDNASRMILWFKADGAGPDLPAYSMYFGNQSTHLPAEPFSTKPNEWQHIAAVYDHSTWKIYLDGQLQAIRENARPDVLSPVNLPHRIGSWNVTGNFDYPGLIDDLRVYDAALNDDDVARIYGEGDGDFVTMDMTSMDTSITGEWTVTYSVMDSSLNVTELNIPVTVFDPDAPTIELLGDATINHEQGDPWTDPGVKVTDKDDNPITDLSNLVVTGEVAPNIAGTYVLTYDFTDDAGHKAITVRRTIHVADTIAPIIQLTGTDTLKIQVGQPFIDPGFSATDSFDGELVPLSSILIPDNLLRKAYTPGYPESILDFDNNGGMLQGLPVGEELVSDGPRGIGVYYDGDGNFLQSGIGLPGGDNFRNLFTGYFRAKLAGTYNFGGESPDDRLVVWLDLDQDNVFEKNGEKGNEMMTNGFVGGYSNVDLEPGYYRYAAAMIEGGGHSRLDIRFTAPEGAGPTIRSRVFPGGPDQESTWFADNTFNTAIPGTHTITYTATDAAGHTVTASRTVIVDDYPDRPKIQLSGRSIIKHPVGTAFEDPGATITDSIGLPIPRAEAVIRGTVNIDVPGKYILTYNYRQLDGLAADTVTRAVEVVDAIPPTITLEGQDTVEIILGQQFIDPGVSAVDNLDGEIPVGSTATLPQGIWLHTDASSIRGFKNGEALPKWADISGNNRDFQVLKGAPSYAATALNGLPAVELSGEDILTIAQNMGNRYTIVVVSQLEGSLNERLISSYNQNWLFGYYSNREHAFHPGAWVTDSSGVPPSIRPHLYSATSTGGNHSRFYGDGKDLTLTPGRNGSMGRLQLGGYQNNFREASAGFVSEVILYDRALADSERLSVEARLATKYQLLGFPFHPLPDFSVLGDHIVLYAATDNAGNTAFATRTVTVKPDPSIPVIELLGEAELRHEAHTLFDDPGAIVKDGDGNTLDPSYLSVIGTIDSTILGIQTLIYRYDSEDLSAEPVSRDVIVVDTAPPVITFTGETVIKLNIGDEISIDDATAHDAVDGEVSLSYTNPIPKITYTPGLLGGGISAGGLQMGENPGDLGIVTGPTLGTTNQKPPWRDNYTVIYTGEIFDQDGTMSFRESIDDIAWLSIDDKVILNNSAWNQNTTGTFVSDSGEGGWFPFELRMSNGTGGAGQVNAPGFGHDPTGGTNFVYPENPDANTPDLFRFPTPITTIALAKEAGTFDIIYTATDSKGNTAQTIRTIVILPAPDTPYIVLNGEPIITIEAASTPTYNDPLAVAHSADGTPIQNDIAGAGEVDTAVPGTYTLTYIYQAQDGTYALPVERSIHVVDTTPPEITLQGDSFLEILVGETFIEPGATATDNLDSGITVVSDLESIPNRLIHRGYLAGFDEARLNFEGNGGLFTQAHRGERLYNGSINYGSDAQFRRDMPAISRNDQYQNLWFGNFRAQRDGDYYFRTDNVDDRATFWLDKNQNGIFERDGDVGDERLTWQTQTTPVYLRKGNYRVAIAHMEGGGGSRVRALFSTPESAGPTTLTVISPASPEQAGIWSTLPQVMDTTQPGRYKINYYAEDSSGNIATTQRTVVIDEDPLKPVLLLLGDAAVTQEAGIPYRDAGVLLEDYTGTPLDETLVTVTGLPDEDEAGQFNILYEYTDPDGHTADPVTRIVNIQDTLPPSIELVGSASMVVPIGQDYKDPGVIVNDLFDQDVTTYNDFAFPETGLFLHLDASSLTETLVDGNVVNIPWPDLSGHGNHFSNRTGDPTLRENALNGLPVVNFDGNDLLWTSTDFQAHIFEFTLVTIARYTGGDNERVISSRNRNWLFGFHNNGTGRFYAEGWISNQGPSDTEWHQHIGTIDNRDNGNFWRDGARLATNSHGANNTWFRPRYLQLGGWENNRESSKCEVAEVILYNRVLSEVERNLLQSHLNAKYDLNDGGVLRDSLDTSTEKEYTLTYYAEDSEGHLATTTRTVLVVDPANLPIITLEGDVEIQHSSGTPFVEPGYIITTPQATPIDGAIASISTNLDVEQPGTYSIAYDFKDQNGYPAQSKIRTITVVDETPPVISLTGGEIWEHQLGNEWVDPGFVAIDAVEGEVLVENSYLREGRLRGYAYQLGQGNTPLNLEGNQGLYVENPMGPYVEFTNGPRNEGVRILNAGEFTRSFPSLTRTDNFEILWDGHFRTESGGRYEFGVENPDDGVSMWIDLDQDEIFELDGDKGIERVNPEDYRYGYRTFDLEPGFYKFAISYREGVGNQSVQARMRALAGKGPSTLSWLKPGANNQKDLWVIYNPFDINAPGENIITYTASDSLGNTTTVTRTVIVKNNPDAPVITLAGEAEIRLPIGDPWEEPGFAVTDFEGQPLDTADNPVRISGEVNPELLGTYKLTYDFTSEEGAPARTARRTVLVVDATPPAITLAGDAEMTIFQGQPFTDPGATAFDDYDGNLQVGSSQNLPMEGLVLHLDASRIKALQEGDPVHVWKDNSPAANHFKFAVGDPRYKAEGINSLPTVFFDGTSQIKTETNFGNRYTISTVSRLHGLQDQRLISSGNRNWLYGYHAGKQNTFHPEDWATSYALSPQADTFPHLHTATSTGGNSVRFYADGADKTLFPNRNGSIGQLQLGAYQTLVQSSIGEVSEVLLYNRVLGTTERLSMEAYLNAKYALNGAPEVNIPVNTLETGTYHVLYQSVDGEGNVGSVTRTVHVVPDPDAPVITLDGEREIIWEAGTPWADPGFTLSDPSGDLDQKLVTIDNPLADDTTTQGEFVITYNYKPFVGAPAPEVSRLVVVRDTKPPVITRQGEAFIKLEQDEVWTDPGYSADDIGTGPVPVISDERLVPNQMSVAVFIPSANNDDSQLNLDQNGGLKALEPVVVNPFTTGPGNRGSDFNSSGEMGSPQGDNFQLLFQGKFFAPIQGIYEFIHNDRDDRITLWLDLDQDGIYELDGDKGDEQIMKINQGGWRPAALEPGVYDLAFGFREDRGREYFEVRMGLPEVLVPYENQLIQPVATKQLGLWAADRVTSTVDTATPGTYTITYHARDITGNATTATRTIVVVDDASKPFIALKGEAVITHELGSPFEEPGATVTAQDGTELEADLQPTVALDITKMGSQTLTYEYTDAVSATRTVTLVDTTAPTAELTEHPTYGGTDTVTLLANQEWVDPGLTLSDGDSTAWFVSSRDYIPNRLLQAGFLLDGNLLDFDNNGGLLAETPTATRFFTTGNANRGFDYNNTDFTRAGIGLTRTDNYHSYVLGYFHARVDGNYFFDTDKPDDDMTFWVDLNQDGVFQRTSEQLTFDTGNFQAFLPAGFYRIIIGHREGGGNSTGRARIQTPFGAGPSETLTNVKPADPAQNGLWLTEGDGPIDTKFPGTHTITYYLMDQSGNTSTITRTVVIEPDPDAPILGLVGEAETHHEQGNPYTDPGVTIKNEAGVDLDPDPLKVTITQDGQVVAEPNTFVPGAVTYLYEYDDGSRTAIPLTRVVEISDTQGPNLSLIGEDTITVPPGFAYIDEGVNADDINDPTPNIRISGDKIEYLYLGSLLDGLVSSWNFEESAGNTVMDPIGENHLKFVGSPTRADTIHGRGLSFNANGSAEAPNSPSLSLTDGLSLSAWFRPTVDQADWVKVAIKSRYDPGDYPFGFGYDNADKFNFILSNNASINVSADALPPLNQWTHALGTWDGTDAKLYINGILQTDTKPLAAPLLVNDLNFTVGGRGGQNNFQGQIDSVAIWNRALTEEEALQLQLNSGIRTFTEGEYQITYTATDVFGNSSSISRTIIVKTDPTIPILSLIGEKEVTHEAGSPYEDPGAVPRDIRDNPLDDTNLTVSGTVDHTKLGDYRLTYNYTNTEGKDAIPVQRIITVIDATPPVIELVGGTEYRVDVGVPQFEDPGFAILDNLDTNLTAEVKFISTSGIEPIAHWEFDQDDGTTLIELQNGLDGTMIAFPDPVADSWVPGKYGNALKFNGSSYVRIPSPALLDLEQFTISAWIHSDDYARNMFIFEKTRDNTVNSQYNLFIEDPDIFFRLNDGVSGFVERTVTTADTLEVDKWHHIGATYDGSIQKLYIDGVLVEQFVQDVIVPTTPAAGNAYIGAFAPGDGYHFQGMIDDLKIYGEAINEADISKIMKRTGIDTSAPTETPYTLEYSTIDSSGNATTIQRKIMVSNDQNAPVITIHGDLEYHVEAATTFVEPGVIATDTEDGSITPLVTYGDSLDNLDMNTPGEYILTYDVTDLSFNHAEQKTRKVIVQDTTAPVITLNGDDEVTVGLGDTYVDAGATALDSLDGDLSAQITSGTTITDIDTSTPAEYTITYDVSDKAGNNAVQVTRKVIVKETDNNILWNAKYLSGLSADKLELLADPDKDNISNLLEYALGSHPNDSADAAILPDPELENDQICLTFRRIKNGTDDLLSYKIQVSYDLSLWGDSNPTFEVLSKTDDLPDNTYEWVKAKIDLPAETPSFYLRINVTRTDP